VNDAIERVEPLPRADRTSTARQLDELARVEEVGDHFFAEFGERRNATKQLDELD
jgi:hypothetical protein